MNNILATWIYEDPVGDETDFPQSGLCSSSDEHKAIYWRCVYMFFVFAKKYMPDTSLVLFTNFSKKSKIIDNIDIIDELNKIGVKILSTEFTYKLPKGYYGSWGNQLYEFDIFNCFLKKFSNCNLLLLDSDCLITQNIDSIYLELDNHEAITFRGEYTDCSGDTLINGITEQQMAYLYNELSDSNKQGINYLCGEFFCARYSFIEKMMSEFNHIFENMISRFNTTKDSKTIKFNKEAHFLSYFYAKYNIPVGMADKYIKRMWTDHCYNTILLGDKNIPIWHVLSGKYTYPELIKINKKLLLKKQSHIIKKLDLLFLHPKQKADLPSKIKKLIKNIFFNNVRH